MSDIIIIIIIYCKWVAKRQYKQYNTIQYNTIQNTVNTSTYITKTKFGTENKKESDRKNFIFKSWTSNKNVIKK